MRFIIYGTGGIGGTIGAQLQQQGERVLFIARGDQGQHLKRHGMRFISPAGEQLLAVEVVEHPREVQFTDEDVVLLCMKSQHSQAALDALYEAGAVAGYPVTDVPIVCAQNGVSNEALALRRFRRVYAMLVLLPATYLRLGEIVVSAADPAGVLDTGLYPEGVDAFARELCDRLTRAGFSATADAKVMRKKYGKLLSNLFNALQLLLPLDKGWDEDTQQLLRQLKREALACYAAAGIECISPEENRAISAQLTMQEVPGFERQGGSTWQSLARGTGDIEVDYLNGEIVRLGRKHGVPTPANETCQRLALDMVLRGDPPGQWTTVELAGEIEACSNRG